MKGELEDFNKLELMSASSEGQDQMEVDRASGLGKNEKAMSANSKSKKSYNGQSPSSSKNAKK